MLAILGVYILERLAIERKGNAVHIRYTLLDISKVGKIDVEVLRRQWSSSWSNSKVILPRIINPDSSRQWMPPTRTRLPHSVSSPRSTTLCPRYVSISVWDFGTDQIRNREMRCAMNCTEQYLKVYILKNSDNLQGCMIFLITISGDSYS